MSEGVRTVRRFVDVDDAWLDEVLAVSPRSSWYQGRGVPLLVDLGRCGRAEAALGSYRVTARSGHALGLLGERVAACVPRTDEDAGSEPLGSGESTTPGSTAPPAGDLRQGG